MADSNTPSLAAMLRCEAAHLRESLTPDRVFRMHAQNLLYRRAKFKLELKFQLSIMAHSLSSWFIVAAVCAYPLAPRGWRSSVLRAGIVGSGVMLCTQWSSIRFFKFLFDPRFALPETLPSDTLEITQKLGWFLDHASSTPPPRHTPQTPRLVPDSTASDWFKAIYNDDPGEDAFYGSLVRNRRTVRLLVVEPGDLEAKIKCTLYRSDVLYPYEALSYVWGDESGGTETITVDGRPFTIRHNLSRALRYLRRKNQKRLIWVDAICINQDDPDDRNYQVAMMSEICEHARRDPVLVCGHRQVDARTFWRGLDLLRERMMADLYPRQGLLRYERPGESRPSLFDDMNDSPVERWHMLQMRHSLLSWRTLFHPVMYSISDILKITRMHKATDPRDHVLPEMYNFFAIGSSLDHPSWVPDFSRGFGHNVHDRFWTLPFPVGAIGQMDCYATASVLVSRGIDFGEATKVMDFERGEENVLIKSRGEPIQDLDEVKKVLSYIRSSVTRPHRNESDDDISEMLYKMFAENRFDPSQTPYITREDVADFVGKLSPSTSLTIAKVLLGSACMGEWSMGSWECGFLNQMREALKSIRRNKHLDLQRLEESRTTRMEQKAERSRLKLEQIQEDLEIDHAEHSKSLEQAMHAADEFELRAQALQKEEEDDTGAWVAAVLPHAMVETDTGLVGIASGAVQEGDRLVLLHGVASLFIARPVGDSGEYSFVGRVMVHQGTAETMANWVEGGVLVEREMSFR
ncbi:hypothetical protein ACJZ2D_001966 [Fusarium nematophilum]